MRIANRARTAIVGAGVALAMAATPAAAGAQAAAPDPVTATYVATYQRECKALNARTTAFNRRIKGIANGARSERQIAVRGGRVIGDFLVQAYRGYRRIVIVPAPPQFAAYQARNKATYLRARPKVRAAVRDLRRARTERAFRRISKRLGAIRALPKPPAALRSAAPACRKALS